jgi:HAD superfamily hydrolase (TIGR01484 family)
VGIVKRVLATDIDGTLIGFGGESELARFLRDCPALGVIYLTGRTKANAAALLAHYDFPAPLAMATDIGADIYWGSGLRLDQSWAFRQRRDWSPWRIQSALEAVPGVRFLGRNSHWRLAFSVADARAAQTARSRLAELGLRARALWYEDQKRLDVMPRGALKGRALKYILGELGLKPSQCFVAGDGDNDGDMISDRYCGVLVANGSARLLATAPPHIVRSPLRGAYGVRHALERWLKSEAEPDPLAEVR